MKQTTFILLALVLLSAFSFTSCEEDKYLDWKYINQSWYEQHKNDDGWTTTASGLQYREIYEGIGSRRPNPQSMVSVTYRGTYITGEEFDSGKRVSFLVSDVVSGFGEVLKLMKRNAIYEVRIPYELGYGKEGSSPIPPYTTLLFRIELHDFMTN